MNITKQFWTLFKFQALSNRRIWYISAMLLMPLYILGVIPRPNSDLNAIISNQYFFIMALPAMLLLMPERYSASTNQWAGNATEFLLTRAIDRNILYRSKATFLYLIVLVIPGIIFLLSFKNPDLQVTLHSDISPELCLTHVPGSTLVVPDTEHSQPLIFI
jgi:hypothetical protein